MGTILETLADMDALVIVTIFGVIPLIGYTLDRRNWNNGVCRESGKAWQYFDTASDGSRGYKDGAGNYTWISYWVDRSN